MSSEVLFVETLRDYQRATARDRARHAAVSVLAGLAQVRGAMSRGLARPRVHFVYLHSVFRDEEAGFHRLLSRLAEAHTFISYSEGVARVRSGCIDRPYVTFSFDDGMKNNLRAAAILEHYGARACFFVCSDIVGETRVETIVRFCRERLHYGPVDFMDWRDIERLLAAGHELGSHTRSHRKLAELDASALVDELSGSRVALSRRLGNVTHFAWPYGRFSDVPAGLGELVSRAGYESCASAVRGCHVAAAEEERAALCLRRDQVVAAWPLAHSLYFLSKSALAASAADNAWPWGARPGASA